MSWNVTKCHQMSPFVIKCHHVKLNVMKCHQMSPFVIKYHHVKLKDNSWHLTDENTMMNSIHKPMKCHQMSPFVIKYHHVKLKDNSWHLTDENTMMNSIHKPSFNLRWWHLMTCHDVVNLIQRGGSEKMKPASFLSPPVCMHGLGSYASLSVCLSGPPLGHLCTTLRY